MSDLRSVQRLDEALTRAYAFLSKRDRTAFEVEQRLGEAEIEPSVIAAALAELRDLGYVDDARYAQRFTQDRRNLDSWGDERIDRRLRELGVERHLIASALADRGEGEPSELDAAVALLRRRFQAPPETPRDQQRAVGILARKGYASELAHDAVRVLLRR
jgi:regulatory protein